MAYFAAILSRRRIMSRGISSVNRRFVSGCCAMQRLFTMSSNLATGDAYCTLTTYAIMHTFSVWSFHTCYFIIDYMIFALLILGA